MEKGIRLGVEEAAHAGKLFGRRIARIDEPSAGNVAAALSRIAQRGAQVVIAAVEDVKSIRDAGAVPVINVGSRSDELRRQGCNPMLFHVQASVSMYSAAAGASGRNAARTRIELWHGALERYGAGQLNDRFVARFGEEMDSDAWAGWMAVKIAWEAFLRAPEPTGKAIASHLARETTQFDGHKGAPLSFRAWDRQLRQPMYAVVPAENGGDAEPRITDIPEVGRSPRPVREQLDSIGDGPAQQACDRGS